MRGPGKEGGGEWERGRRTRADGGLIAIPQEGACTLIDATESLVATLAGRAPCFDSLKIDIPSFYELPLTKSMLRGHLPTGEGDLHRGKRKVPLSWVDEGTHAWVTTTTHSWVT